MAKDIGQLVKEAAEAAKSAPDHLQEAAFNKAFEVLSGAQGSVSAPGRVKSKGRGGAIEKATNDLDKLNRTAHPEIQHGNSALNNAFYLLRAAKDELGIDGVSASDLARVLAEKFRCRVTRQAVSRVLNSAGKYADRVKQGNSVLFRIMAPGEEYLDNLAKQTTHSSKPSAMRKKGKKKASKRIEGKTASGPPRKRRATGPAAAMSQLYDTGFFVTHRSIAEIVESLKHDLGRTFKTRELSSQLLRWRRSGKLVRQKNSDGRYEYKQH